MNWKRLVFERPVGIIGLSAISVLVGSVAGLGAVTFRLLIALFHNLFFLGKLSFAYNANVHTPPSPWGPLIILAPALAALGVVFFVKNFAPEAKGHGVPEVMDATYYNNGIIRPIVAVIKSIASALSIGSGGSVGREGPMIQIGASCGSTIGQALKMPTWQRITLIAAGGGGGIAAAFNTPVGGILFAVEILMHEVSVRTLVPVAISTVTATYIGRLFFGKNPSFVIPDLEAHSFRTTRPEEIFFYLGLGIFIGLVSVLYIATLYGAEDFLEKWISNYYVRHASGMLAIGLVIYLLQTQTGHYYIEGVGYSTIQDILTGTLQGTAFLAVLFTLKLLSTSTTIGSGASGGIFSPGMYLGAAAGAAFGVTLRHLFPASGINVSAFAIAGMAGVIGGSTGAAVTAIVMIFEMTLDYSVILPITITVAISDAVRRLMTKETIYTRKLIRRGHPMPEALQANFHQVRPASDLMDRQIRAFDSFLTLGHFAGIISEGPSYSRFLVALDNFVVGVITRDSALMTLEEKGENVALGEAACRDFITIDGTTPLLNIVARMEKSNAEFALVVRPGSLPAAAGVDSQKAGGAEASRVPVEDVQGIISKDLLAEAMMSAMQMFSG